ncbi:MAG: hypothetical protein AB7Y46_05155 [Armatimonadota bacterium]
MTATASDAAVFALRPMGLGDLLDAMIGLYRRHVRSVIGIAAVVYVPLGLLQVVAAALVYSGVDLAAPAPSFTDLSIAGLGGLGLVVFMYWLVMPLLQGAMARAVAEYYLGGEATIRSAYGYALRYWPSLLLVALVMSALRLGLCVLAIAPIAVAAAYIGLVSGDADPMGWLAVVGVGLVSALVAVQAYIYFTTRFAFSALAIVLEREGTMRGMGRSWSLSAGHFWRVLLTLTILWAFYYLVTGIIVWPAQIGASFLPQIPLSVSYAALSGLSVMAQLLFQPLLVIGTVLLYYDLRMRKEGFDLAMMAEAIGEPELAARSAAGRLPAPLFGPGAAPPDAVEAADVTEDTDHIPGS